MKIVHIAPGSAYNEGWSYQENLLTKYQAKMGFDVTLIVANQKFESGKVVKCDEYDTFSKDGFRVVARKYKKVISKRITNTLSLMKVDDILEQLQPDLIFFHCLISTTILQVKRYVKKHRQCKLVIDNHLDFNIGYKPSKSLIDFLVVCFYRFIFKCVNSVVCKVYGVTPWRKVYAEKMFGVPSNKTDVLIMGADDENIRFQDKTNIRKRIRTTYNIAESVFLIVTGGKIDSKKNIHLLMDS